MNTQTKDFANWTEYNDWNIENYSQFSVVVLNEVEGGKIHAEYVTNEEWLEEAVRLNAEKEAKAQAEDAARAQAKAAANGAPQSAGSAPQA